VQLNTELISRIKITLGLSSEGTCTVVFEFSSIVELVVHFVKPRGCCRTNGSITSQHCNKQQAQCSLAQLLKKQRKLHNVPAQSQHGTIK